MALPISSINKMELTEDQVKQLKLEDLQTLFTNNEDALNTIFAIVGELNDMGVLKAANSMLNAKEEIAKIALDQVTREPVTNLINNLMGTAGALTDLDPELTKKLLSGVTSGMNEGNNFLQNDKKITMFELIKVLNDPDFNRAVGFGINFMKGLGKN